MNTWFECTAKYIKIDENGREKNVSENYLLNAVSFTEAESRIYKELETMVSGEFSVSRITKTKIAEIIPSDNGDRWYKSKVAFITVDEESGKEKRITQSVLVFSDNIKNVYDQIIEAMQGMMADFEISGINESTIMDVFPYEEQQVPENFKPVSSSIQIQDTYELSGKEVINPGLEEEADQRDDDSEI
jgi:hypothetical protein